MSAPNYSAVLVRGKPAVYDRVSRVYYWCAGMRAARDKARALNAADRKATLL